jgi:hypothetical protein
LRTIIKTQLQELSNESNGKAFKNYCHG